MLGELRGAATLPLCALLLTLAITWPSAQSLDSGTIVLLVAVAIASVAKRHVTAPTVSAAPSGQPARTSAPRLCCPVLAPDDPACPRAPGIG